VTTPHSLPLAAATPAPLERALSFHRDSPMTLVSMKDLLLLQLKDLYSAETQLVRALPAMIKGSGAPALRRTLQQHLRQTEEQVDRLQAICEALDTYPGGHRCRGMEGMIEEVRLILRAIGTQSVVDAAILAVAQRIEHYEAAAYVCAKTYATLLGLDTVVDLLAVSLREQEAADKRFTEIAEQEVNDRALVGMVEDLSFR